MAYEYLLPGHLVMLNYSKYAQVRVPLLGIDRQADILSSFSLNEIHS